MLELISSLLSIEGYSTSTVETGEAAIEFLINNQPDLILLDRTLPGIDGFEVCKQIKGIRRLAKIPIIFLTASTDVKEKVEGFRIGAVDYITKPFQKEELLARVNSHFELYKLSQLLKEQTEVLKESERNLSDLNATKDKFFSIIAHDLKGSFSNIFELSKLLKEKCGESNEAKAKEIIQHLYSTAENTRNLLENLLDWASIQRGKMAFNPEIINLNSAVSECFDVLMAISKSKSISMTNNISPKTTVFADINMLKTILRNLVSNAIKFTPNGGSISISKYHKNNKVEVCVLDTGVGMNLKTTKELFKISKVQSTYGTEGEQGTGLGLLLCKEFVERHRGKIWVESEIGAGTKFWFSLPWHDNLVP